MNPTKLFVMMIALALPLLSARVNGAPDGGTEGQPAPHKVNVPPGTKVINNIEYVPGGGNSRSLDLYLPSSGQAVPLVVWIHGGGWHTLDKSGGSHAIYLIPHGYAVASINYRLSQEAPFPAQIEDCRAAIRFLRAHAATYHIQPDHIAVWGASAGGHLAALVGTSPAVDFGTSPATAKVAAVGKVDESVRVQCIVDWYGPTDFTKLMGPNPIKVDNAAIKLLGPHASEAELMEKARWGSPVTYVRSDNPPFLIEHGDSDPTVPLQQSQELFAALQKAGVEATLKVIPDSLHGGKAFASLENGKLILDFLDQHLKSGKEARQK